MRVIEQYLNLYDRFAEGEHSGIAVEVSLEEAAGALYCTTRNAKLVLRRLCEDGFIQREAGRGRGNRSKLYFLMNKEDLLVDTAQRLAEKGDYQKAFELLQSYGGATSANRRFMEWLDDSFGFHTEEGEERDIFRFPSFVPILTIDPAEAYFAVTGHMIRQLFDSLLYYDAVEDRIMPGIAHYWESNEQATEFTLHLRKGILFHNGRELTSADVAFTLNRVQPGKRNSWIMRSVSHIETPSKRIVNIYLNKPNFLFLRFLCSVTLSILPNEYAGQSELQFWKRPIGTGPFMVQEWTEASFTMHANPYYFQGRPHLDSVEMVVIPQHYAAAVEMKTKGWRQLLYEKEQFSDLASDNEWLQKEANVSYFSLLIWNMKKDGPQQSLAFRHAIDLLIDRGRMIQELGDHRDYPALGFFTNKSTALHQKYDESNYKLAINLLREANYNGECIHLYAYGTHALDAEWITKRCKEAGVHVQLHTVSMDLGIDAYDKADGFIQAQVFPEAEVCLIEYYEQEGSFMREYALPSLGGYVESMIDRALACKDTEERKTVLGEIETTLKAEFKLLFLLSLKFQSPVHPSFKGVDFTSLGWIDFKHVWR